MRDVLANVGVGVRPFHVRHMALPMLVVACATHIPEAERATTVQSEWIDVPTRPPAALPEIVSERPREDAVWVDGTWDWRAGRWVWERGGWVRMPRGVYYYPGATEISVDGRILYDAPKWVDAWGRPTDAPRMIRVSSGPSGAAIVTGQEACAHGAPDCPDKEH